MKSAVCLLITLTSVAFAFPTVEPLSIFEEAPVLSNSLRFVKSFKRGHGRSLASAHFIGRSEPSLTSRKHHQTEDCSDESSSKGSHRSSKRGKEKGRGKANCQSSSSSSHQSGHPKVKGQVDLTVSAGGKGGKKSKPNSDDDQSGQKGGSKSGNNHKGSKSTSNDDSTPSKAKGKGSKGSKSDDETSSDTKSSTSTKGSTTGEVSDGADGTLTFYTQDGTQGACGLPKVGDSALVVALSPRTFKQNCGKTMTITNLETGKTVHALCNDECPECDDNHIDGSLGVWDGLGSPRSLGVAKIQFSIS